MPLTIRASHVVLCSRSVAKCLHSRSQTVQVCGGKARRPAVAATHRQTCLWAALAVLSQYKKSCACSFSAAVASLSLFVARLPLFVARRVAAVCVAMSKV